MWYLYLKASAVIAVLFGLATVAADITYWP
jgi:hypothetical protein